MKRILSLFGLVFLLMNAIGCSTSSNVAKKVDDNVIQLNVLQINDVYEITPVNGQGGLAKVATLRNQLKAENPNTISVMAGDFFSPSAIGTAKVNGERLAGKQMVATLNAMGLDYATFGNHEFDLKADQFAARMGESKFKWVSANCMDANSKSAFTNVPDHHIYQVVQVTNGKEKNLKVGIFGVTLDKNQPPYVSISDYLAAARDQVRTLRPQVDILIALTHLELSQDITLAQELPEIDLIMGGHEHENIIVKRGADMTPITKADANAHTVYVHRFSFNTQTRKLSLKSELVPVTNDILDDPAVAAVANEWTEKGFSGFRAEGFEPTRIAGKIRENLDGTEASVRNKQTNMGAVIAEGMMQVVPNAVAGIFNSGSIRLDDYLSAGDVSEYDVIRVLPFGGEVLSVAVKGSMLKKLLNQGMESNGKGAYLQYTRIRKEADGWKINGNLVDDNATYTIATSDYLATGKEFGMDFFNVTANNPDVKQLGKFGDIRKAMIQRLQR